MKGPEQTSWIELSRSALRRNLRFIRSVIGDRTELVSMVKGNAYGHGIEEFVPLAESLGVTRFAVFDAYEAERVVAVKRPETPLMITGMIDAAEVSWAVENGIEIWVADRGRLEAALAAGTEARPARVHLELETGMNRTGFPEPELPLVAERLVAAGADVEVAGVCTHFAGAESLDNYLRVTRQVQRFRELVASLTELGVATEVCHMECSAGAMMYRQPDIALARIGILQYGYWPSEETRIHWATAHDRLGDRPLRRVISWRSRVMSVKEVRTGEYVGYGSTYLAARPSRIASVPVGYAHGYARSLSDQGRILVRGRRVPVVGKVNMNMLMADVTNVPGVQAGDEVVLIGSQNSQAITVGSFSEMSNQLNYELLTRLPAEIPRRVVA